MLLPMRLALTSFCDIWRAAAKQITAMACRVGVRSGVLRLASHWVTSIHTSVDSHPASAVHTLPMATVDHPALRALLITPEGEKRWTEPMSRGGRTPRGHQRVSPAAANGDRSENGDYLRRNDCGKSTPGCGFCASGWMHCKSLRVFQDGNKAWFGAWVTLEDEEGIEQGGELGPDEFDVSQGKISCDLHLGGRWVSRLATTSSWRPRRAKLLTLIDVEYRSHRLSHCSHESIDNHSHYHYGGAIYLHLQRCHRTCHPRASLCGRNICR